MDTVDKKEKYCYEYPRPALTVDCVLFGFEKLRLKILLIERKDEPYKDCWALPGGFVEMNETTEQAASRELLEETGLANIYMEQFHTFSTVDRDPRGRVVSVAYLTVVNIADCKVKAGDDAKDSKWFYLEDLPQLAFDHDAVIKVALSKLKDTIRI